MSKDSVVSQRVQDSFVYLAITSTDFLKVARRSVKAKYFSSQVTEDIVDICYGYFDQFGAAPDQQFHDELVRFLDKGLRENKQLYIDYLTRLQGINQPNQPYVIARINEFVQARAFEESAIKFVGLTKEGKFEEARHLMQSTLREGIVKEEVGLRYLDEKVPAYYESDQTTTAYLIPTGFPIIDKRLTRGLRRTDFVCILGGAKGKKSWACIYLGREALLKGLKVLHITHENSAEDTEMRYDMMLGGLTSDREKSHVEIENIDDHGNVVSTEIIGVKSVWDLSHVTKVRRRVRRFGGELIIKKYPMGSCTMEEVRRYLDYIETYDGFFPDVIINDYVEAMKLPKSDERRNAINEVYVQSKGLADERKVLMITVSQTNRAALRKKIPDQKDFAEDIRKMANVDLVLSEGQTKQQSVMNRMQMWVLANRHGPMDFGCVFALNLDIGQLCVSSWPIKWEEKTEEEDED